MDDRKVLLEASRKRLDETGYTYKKGKSRSKHLSSDNDEGRVQKRQKISKDFRLSRISELKEQIEDKDEQINYKELRSDGAKNLHNYN